MDYGEILLTVGKVLLGLVVFALFSWMFVRGVLKGELVFHGGIIRGWLARVVGVLGLLGMASSLYLLLGYVFLSTELPGTPVAFSLMCLASVVLLALRFASIFWFHPK